METTITWTSDEPDRTGTIEHDGFEIANIRRMSGTNAGVYEVTDCDGGICYVGNSERDAIACALARLPDA